MKHLWSDFSSGDKQAHISLIHVHMCSAHHLTDGESLEIVFPNAPVWVWYFIPAENSMHLWRGQITTFWIFHCEFQPAEIQTICSSVMNLPVIRLLGGLVVKNPPANAGDTGDMGSVPGSGRSPGGKNGSPLPYSCLESPMDRGAWRAAVYSIAKSLTPLSDHTCAYWISGGLLLPSGGVWWLWLDWKADVRLEADERGARVGIPWWSSG